MILRFLGWGCLRNSRLATNRINSFELKKGIASNRCYTYHIVEDFFHHPVDVWLPQQPSTLKTAVSYLLYDPNAIGIDEIEDNSNVQVYPKHQIYLQSIINFQI